MRACYTVVIAVAVLASSAAWTQEATAQVYAWNSDVLDVDAPGKVVASNEPLKPIVMVAARNGAFSGKVCVGSAGPIAGLKAVVSELKGDAGAIAASAIGVRYGVAWGDDLPNSKRKPAGLDILLEEPPAEVPVGKTRGGSGAVAAVWVTVMVPADAKAGVYRGQLTIEAKGAKGWQAPVELQVSEWTIPDTQDWRTWVEMIEVPDTLTLEYGVPLWSDEHWAMIGRSMNLMGRCGSRSLYMPLISGSNLGNAESMVRWVMKGQDKIEYDFTVFDRYLDLAIKEMGKPKLVVLNVWDIFMVPGGAFGEDWWAKLTEAQRNSAYCRELKERGDLWRSLQAEHGNGPPVTVIDPESKETLTVYLPSFADPRSKAQWQPLLAQIRERMRKRGIDDVLMLGMLSDAHPTKEEVVALKEISGGLPWASHSHSGKFFRSKQPPMLHGVAPIAYDANVWDLRYAPDPAAARPPGWARPEMIIDFDRFNFNSYLPTTLRHMAEFDITGEQRGVGRLGADNWPCIRDKRGSRVGYPLDRYPQSMWRHLAMLSYLLAPGPKGPVATGRYEIFRGGIQECEARITIERALIDDALRAKLGDDLAARCQKHLDERLTIAWKGAGAPPTDVKGAEWRYKQHPQAHEQYVKSGWQQRSGQLFALAAEVTAKLAH